MERKPIHQKYILNEPEKYSPSQVLWSLRILQELYILKILFR